MDAIRFIEQAYWQGWLKGLFLGGTLGAVVMMAICLRDEIKLAWRRARVKKRS